MKWGTYATLTLNADRGDLSLTITLTPMGNDEWLGLAIEHEKQSTSIDAVLASHSHENIGPFSSLGKATRACESYASQWMKSGKVRESCGCGPIKKRTRK